MAKQSQNTPATTASSSSLKSGDVLKVPEPVANEIEKIYEEIEKNAKYIQTVKNQIDKDKENIEDSIKSLNGLVIFGLVALIIMVGLSVYQSWEERAKSYADLIEKVDALNAQFQTKDANDWQIY